MKKGNGVFLSSIGESLWGYYDKGFIVMFIEKKRCLERRMGV